jgi:hypothetical protein
MVCRGRSPAKNAGFSKRKQNLRQQKAESSDRHANGSDQQQVTSNAIPAALNRPPHLNKRFSLVTKLQLGNSVLEAPASSARKEAGASSIALPSRSLATSVELCNITEQPCRVKDGCKAFIKMLELHPKN